MATFRAVVFREPGSADVLHVQHLPKQASLAHTEVRVRLTASGINRAEVLQRQGKSAPPPGVSPHLGLEGAGTVVEVGSEVKRWHSGERVMLLADGGAYAEEIVVDQARLLPVPTEWTEAEAGGFMETTLTAFLNIFQIGGVIDAETKKVKPNGTVLVHGGGSGVGTQAIKLCKAKGITVIATAGSEEKCAACRQLGADHTVNYRSERYEEVVQRLEGADVILDNIGGEYLARDLACLRQDGRVVFIGLMGGREAKSIDLGQLLGKRAHVIGSTLRNRSNAFKARLIADLEADFGDSISNGKLRPIIDKTFTLEEAPAAHKRMESSQHFGKIVLLTGT